jgi:RimJ/RimL family protein N-acetyltransferase
MEILVTRRLTLRPPLEVDADDLALHLGNWNVSRWLTRVPFPYDRVDALEWIAESAAKPDEGGVFTIHRERLIGAVGLEADGTGARLGYWLAEDHWGQGLMGEALGAVLGHAFARRPGLKITSSVLADNAASIRLQKRLGFRVTGGGETFSAARQALVPAIHTELEQGRFKGLAGAAYPVAA